MNNYVDKYGLWNVKPVKEDLLPTGNDGFILTAYAKKLGFDVDMEKVHGLFLQLPKESHSFLPVRRLPYKETPYVSRDVILGWYWLGLISVTDLVLNDWSFSPFETEPFKPLVAVKQFWDIRNKDRNYFWKNNYKQVYRFAFSVPVTDRAYMLKNSGLTIPSYYSLYEKVSQYVSSDNISSKLIAWAKSDEKPDPKLFRLYFGDEHPFTQKVLGLI